MDDPFDLQRFVEAQNPVIDDVMEELRRGRKTRHWMWFVFPQIAGLGHSAMAQRYAIGSLPEARAYLRHDLLGGRLRDGTRLVNAVTGRRAGEIFGSPDDMKFRSSMTLFTLAASGDSEFSKAIDRYFGGQGDPRTLALIDRASEESPVPSPDGRRRRDCAAHKDRA